MEVSSHSAAPALSTSHKTPTAIATMTFMATGLGVALPGALLPVLLIRWSMTDQQAGLLFFLFFLGSASGALASRGSLNLSIVRGCLATAAAAAALAFTGRLAVYPAILLYGFGLGISMTSISLLQSRLYVHARAAQMARLNLMWSVGALLGPFVLLRGAASMGTAKVLLATAALFVLLGVLTLVFVKHVEAEARSMTGWLQQMRSVPTALLAMVPLAVGVESAVGGWLATYSKRSGQTLGVTIGAATCFWAGMLLSRLLQSHKQIATSTSTLLLRYAPALMGVSLLLILATQNGPAILVGALCMGIGVGPMYPLLLALVLRHGEGGNTVFILAGWGATLLPLMTGLASGWAHSLRAGLGVSLLGTIVLAVCGILVAGYESRSKTAPSG